MTMNGALLTTFYWALISQTEGFVCPPGAFDDVKELKDKALSGSLVGVSSELVSDPLRSASAQMNVAFEKLSHPTDVVSKLKGSIEIRRLILSEPYRSASLEVRQGVVQRLRDQYARYSEVDDTGKPAGQNSVAGRVWTKDALQVAEAWIDENILPSDEFRFSTNLVSHRDIQTAGKSFRGWSDIATQSDQYFANGSVMNSYSPERIRDSIRSGLPVRLKVSVQDPKLGRKADRTFIFSSLLSSDKDNRFEVYAFEAGQPKGGLWKLERSGLGFKLTRNQGSGQETLSFADEDARLSQVVGKKNRQNLAVKDPLVLLMPLTWEESEANSSINALSSDQTAATKKR